MVEALFARVADAVRAFRLRNSGGVAMTFALTVIPITLLAGMGIDFTRASQARVVLQNAVDAAVLAGARQSSNQVTTAQNTFKANLAASPSLTATATATFTLNADESVSGTAQANLSTVFLTLMSVKTLGLTATAKASGTPSTVCILVVDATATQALLVNSGANVNAPGCEIDVDSTANPAAIFNAGSTLNVSNICVKSANVTNNGGNPPVQTNCPAISDPFKGTLPTVTVGGCTYTNAVYSGSTVTLAPGVYCGSTNFNGAPQITFNPGLYVIKQGTMTINAGATLTGNGVTFYFADQNSKIQFNGGITAQLLAPNSGTYANILMFEPPGLSLSQVVFDGTKGESLAGLIYLPSRQVTFNSVSNVTSEQMTMVVDALIIDSTNWSFTSSPLSMQGATSSGEVRLLY
jgi:Flp pilus assembly protein TadG